MRDVIPDQLFEAIQDHFRHQSRRAKGGWESGSEEEDTLTGDIGAYLRRGWTRRVLADGALWRWRATYKKFRGRGRDALENKIGADGIVQVEVRRDGDPVVAAKGVLFQAKKGRLERDAHLMEQMSKMEILAPAGSVVFQYRADGCFVAPARDLLAAARHNQQLGAVRPAPLGDYLADTFLPCGIGLRDMYYDAVRSVLMVPLVVGRSRLLQARIVHRIALEVERRPIILV